MLQKWEVIKMIKEHNDSIDSFIHGELAEKLGAKNGRISFEQWFIAQKLINEQNFYDKAMVLLNKCRDDGFDVKINMQSNKLVYYGTLDEQDYIC